MNSPRCFAVAFVLLLVLAAESVGRNPTVASRDSAETRPLAEAGHMTGASEESEAACTKILGSFNAGSGVSVVGYADKLNGLAMEDFDRGYFDDAKSCLRRVFEIRKTRLDEVDEAHPEYATSLEKYATSLNNLGSANLGLGEHYYAGSYLLESLQIRETILEELDNTHPVYHKNLKEHSVILNNVASVYNSLGDYSQAELFYVKVLRGLEVRPGATNRKLVGALINLGEVHVSLGQLAKAESNFSRAGTIIEENGIHEFEKEFFTLVNNVADLFHVRGEMAQAEAEYEEAEEHFAVAESLYERILVFLKEHHTPNFAITLNNLADFYVLHRRFAEAEPLYHQALDIFRDSHEPHFAKTLGSLAELYVLTHRPAAAKALYVRALDLSREILERTAPGLSERQQLATERTYRSFLDGYLSVVLSHPSGEDPKAVYERVLRWKGAVFVRQRRYRLEARDNPLLLKELLRIAQLLDREGRPETAVEEDRVSLLVRRDALEAQLSRRSSHFRRAQNPVNPEDVAAALPEGFVLIDFLEFGRTFLDEAEGSSYRRSIVAWVLHPNGSADLVDIGDIASMGIHTFLTCIRNHSLDTREELECRTAGQKLRKRLWEPLLPVLGTVSAVLISPDGILGQLPWAALPGIDESTYLIDTYQISILPVPQLLPLLTTTGDRQQGAEGLLLLGQVDYDWAALEGQEDESFGILVFVRSLVRKFAFSLGLARRTWLPLRGSGQEIDRIAEFFRANANFRNHPVNKLKMHKATEGRFVELAPRFAYLHVSTHGEFDPRDKHTRLTTLGSLPGLDSGLVFAGANRNSEMPHPSNGILTATEAAVLPLDGVELVTLSACDTGLGYIASGEGLLGMQRAFQVAGARSTVASLWKVHNKASIEFMEHFYENLWLGGLTRLEAFRKTQLWLKNKPEYSHPFYWAAFQLSGAWR